ncbi:MAG: hypothetical protein MASP_00130 [Candidatus Methanolliviera sp. GoM_asphalt]|nr:MAG: hypothetical protein MASP_00130 [Candidatus Methanolliviera sp. GoM_asphalt]
MPENFINRRSTNETRTRVRDISPLSGMCAICIEDCDTLCEIGKSALRGREVLYPTPEYFGKSTAASNKDYTIDWSHFQIMTTVFGAGGIEVDEDKAIFPNADITTEFGGVPLNIPVIVAGLGSTAVAKRNWDGLAVGSAISGTIITVGENVCGMDPKSKFENGKVTYSKDLKYRIDTYRELWDGKHGEIVLQTNVEDERFGVDEYAISKLEVNVIERKWGQGAKAIGGEVMIDDLDKAIMLKKRGYIVLPDPEDKNIQKKFKDGVFKRFERHSRVGMPNREGFVENIERLREKGAKKVFMKTGAYRPAVVAATLRYASDAKIDAITFDGAGGGTGMSPIPMMQECSTPTVWLQAQVLRCLRILKDHGRHIPDVAIAGGFTDETQVFKSIAMGNFGDEPYVKTVAMARAPITAVMKAKHFAEKAKKGELQRTFVDNYGNEPEQFFICMDTLKRRYGEDYDKIPYGAIGFYTYLVDKVGTGLKQLMAGVRKFKLNEIDRKDLASLTERAAEISGIPTIEEVEKDDMEGILLD